jgi:hypothetical protein
MKRYIVFLPEGERLTIDALMVSENDKQLTFWGQGGVAVARFNQAHLYGWTNLGPIHDPDAVTPPPLRGRHDSDCC